MSCKLLNSSYFPLMDGRFALVRMESAIFNSCSLFDYFKIFSDFRDFFADRDPSTGFRGSYPV